MWDYHVEEHIPPKTPSWNSWALTFWTHLPTVFRGHHPCIYGSPASVTYSQRNSSAYLFLLPVHPETNKTCETNTSGVRVWVPQVRQTVLSVWSNSICVSSVVKLTLINHGFGWLRHSITNLSSPTTHPRATSYIDPQISYLFLNWLSLASYSLL